MKTIHQWLILVLKLYVAVAFVVVAVLSPPALSFIPALLVAAYLFIWWRPPAVAANLVADLFGFFSLAILFSQKLAPYLAALVVLPVLVLITRDLEIVAQAQTTVAGNHRLSPTKTGIAMLAIVGLTLVAGALVNSLVTIVTSGVAIVYFGALFTTVFLRVPRLPVGVDPVQERIVAGSSASLKVTMTSKTALGGILSLHSPYEWLNISPDTISFTGPQFDIQMTLTPLLSGPSSITLQAVATDRWGLTQTQFKLMPLTMHVIPRARYAAWLAKRYLTESRMGMLPLVSTISMIRPLYGLRVGVEYYGSQLYQPGDSLKNIDWKHSIKYGELISKEFAEFRGQPAILLVNLAAGDAEEADRQAYNLVVAALSLAKEQIPTAIATYDDEDIHSVTNTLQPANLVARAIELSQQIRTVGKPVKYLAKPDVVRLRANIRRLQSVDIAPARTLVELLQVEYINIRNRARSNPATRALAMAFVRTGGSQSTIVVISQMNHDAEAVMFIATGYGARGNATLLLGEAPERQAVSR